MRENPSLVWISRSEALVLPEGCIQLDVKLTIDFIRAACCQDKQSSIFPSLKKESEAMREHLAEIKAELKSQILRISVPVICFIAVIILIECSLHLFKISSFADRSWKIYVVRNYLEGIQFFKSPPKVLRFCKSSLCYICPFIRPWTFWKCT